MRILSTIVCLVLVLSSCGKKETITNPEFQGFAQDFAELSLPLKILVDKEMDHNIHPIAPELAGKYFGTAPDQVIYAAGKVAGPGYFTLLYYTEDEMAYSVTAAFFDGKGVRKTPLVIQNTTEEVTDRIASRLSNKLIGQTRA